MKKIEITVSEWLKEIGSDVSRCTVSTLIAEQGFYAYGVCYDPDQDGKLVIDSATKSLLSGLEELRDALNNLELTV